MNKLTAPIWKSKTIGESKIFMDKANIVLIQNDGIQIQISNFEFEEIIKEYQQYHNETKQE